MRWFTIAIMTILCISTIPASSADGDGIHWNGYGLDRDSIPNRVLIDQDGNPYSIQKGNADVIVAAFIFTTCVDVCPVITNNLIQAEKQLDDIDYQFISITVDPATDSPEVLKEYMENYDATWPHLTGDLVDLEQVWDDFQISVLTEEIESHSHDHGDIVNATVYDVLPNGWDQLTAAGYQNNWTINASESQWGHYITGINGDDSPSNNSWWWELHSWNESDSSWEENSLGIDSADIGHLAFAPNSTDDSLIPIPDMENDTFVVMLSDGTSDSSILSDSNAWHMTLAALDSFDAPTSQWGHYMSSIDNVSAPDDNTWWWQLHYWNMTSDSWDESSLGMDNLYDQMHIAWAPNSTMDSMIPSPHQEDDHGGHGDHGSHDDMEEGSGETVTVVMPEENHTSNETTTSTSHSTQTFILDGGWNPVVVFTGYDWDIDGFVEDVERAAGLADHPHDDDSGLPGFTFLTVAASLGLAVIAISRDEK